MEVPADVQHGLSLVSETGSRVTADQMKQVLNVVSRSLAHGSLSHDSHANGCRQADDDSAANDDLTRAEDKLACLSLISLLSPI